MREQVCKYMCPYARFQSVMFDHDTLIIAYDEKRGEPRGARGKSVDRVAAGMGDCIDCKHLRAGVPDRHRHPRRPAIRVHRLRRVRGRLRPGDGQDGLSTRPHPLCVGQNALAQGLSAAETWRRVLRPRTLIYTAILLAITVAAGVSLLTKNPLKVDVIRDRGALAREASPGVIENVYRVQIMNTSEQPHRFRMRAEGLPGIAVAGVPATVEVAAGATRLLPVRLQVPAEAAPAGSHRVELVVEAEGDAAMVRRERSTFILPKS